MESYKNTDASMCDLYAIPPVESYSSTSSSSNGNWDSAQHARMVAHSLGVHAPEAEASTSFHPGYQWWPSQLMNTEGLQPMPVAAPTSVGASASYGPLLGYAQPQRHTPHPPPSQALQTSAGMQEPFTFGQGYISQEYTHSVNYAPFHFDRHYASQASGSRHDPAPQQ